MSYISFITQHLSHASEIARTSFGKVSSITKKADNNQVLTATDMEIGRHLINEISKTYPKHNIIDEEAGSIDNGSEYTWVIDPIDGTSNFASGVPTYGIMIGLLHKDKPLIGGVAIPEFHDIYIAQKNKGAEKNSKKITVNTKTTLSDQLFCYAMDGHPETPNFTKEETDLLCKIILKIRNQRCSNSIFDSVMVAVGAYGGEINRTSRIWDNVARQILIEEAGGVYTAYDGSPIMYTKPLSLLEKNYEYCNGTQEVYRQIQSIIKSFQANQT